MELGTPLTEEGVVLTPLSLMVLIIYAHPSHEGHSGYFLSETVKLLEEKKISYGLLDLYALKYDPLLRKEEVYSLNAREVSSATKNMQKKISDHDLFIFIFPVWWGSMPAILKGFFDKTLTPGFAFRFVHGIPVKLLKGKRAIAFMPSGYPRLISFFRFRNAPHYLLSAEILGFCGIKTKTYVLGSSRRFTEERKKKIERIVKRALKNI